MKPGRNDPCPCGSGKKYKHCCLAASATASESPADFRWRRLRRLLDGYPPLMLRFVQDIYGPTAIDEAWRAFMLWDEGGFEPDERQLQLFMPWFFHCWSPDPADTALRDPTLHDVPPTRAYLARRGRSLDPLLRSYLDACIKAPLSFHEVLDSDPGQGVRLRDVMTGQEFEVTERSASRSLQRGDMVFGQVVEIGGLALLEASCPFAIPPHHKASVVELRARILPAGDPIARDALRDFDFEMLELYHEIFAGLFNPTLPRLQNTDGDPLSLQKLVYDIDSPQGAFDALKHLCLDETDENLLSDAVRNPQGDLVAVHFSWLKRGNAQHPSWENTVLGTITIDGPRLTIEVNSQHRAEEIRRLVEQALGDAAHYRATEIQSVEKLLEHRANTTKSGDNLSSSPLAESPEVRAKLTEMLEQHYDNWINEKIPLLGDRTPIEAVKDRDGREIVESLILDIERRSKTTNLPLDATTVRRLRERLGLLP